MSALTTTTHVAGTLVGAVAGTILIGTAGVLLMPAAAVVGAGALLAAVAIPSVGTAIGGYLGYKMTAPPASTVQQIAALPNPPIVGHV
jgi:archaellin